MPTTQADIVAFLDRRTEALRRKDIDQLMSFYAPDVVYFDLVPPLRYLGAAALRSRFVDWFEGWHSAISQEVRDLTVLASDEVAAAHMLIRTSGTRTNGQHVGYWVRATDFCKRSGQGWLITHEHISVPVDVKSRSAVMDLVP